MITKTLFTQSVQCFKLAHIRTHSAEKLKEDSLGVKFRKKQGTLVGELAKKLYPNHVDLSYENDFDKIYKTRDIEKVKVPFYEASALADTDLFARADILIPNNDGTYNIIEIKSDTSIKPEHIPDVSFQYYVFKKAGYNIREVKIAHSNNEYLKQGEIDPNEYFIIEDVTNRLINVEEQINQLRTTLGQDEPTVQIGRHCTTPFECPNKHNCWKFLPKNNVTQLYFDKKLGFELLQKGILEIKNIPEDVKQSGRGKSQREIQIQVTKNNQIHKNDEEIKKWVNSLIYPVKYFDFETYAPAIPIFNNSRPWQRIPFQYSVHIEKENGNIEHKEFLATSKEDPRENLVKQMIADLGDVGSIVVYNQTFEKSVIKELIRDFPQFEKELNGFLARIIDLAEPFEKFHYYNPEQMGRYSIKVILPLFCELSYKGLSVSNGEEAFCAFEDILNGDLSKIDSLKEYCKLDTLAEVEIVKKLK